MRHKKIRNIICFDFDKTLIYTPEPEMGIPNWEENKGCSYPHKGWWAREESLDCEVFEMVRNEWVYEKWVEAMEQPDTLVIMMTGRIKKLSSAVHKILDVHKLSFDRTYFSWGGPTLDFKTKVFTQLVEEFNPDSLTMYDDRTEHIGPFMTWGQRIKKQIGTKVHVIHVG
jgi:hypothetical protein